MGRAACAAAWLAIVLCGATFGVSCRNERPVECQRLRKCCGAAMASDREVADIKLACEDKDDTNADLCLTRIERVLEAVPTLAYDEACRAPVE
ncbi:MAG: hypothetical protein ACHREM_10615 [Polyangiales bacterium]